MNRLFISVYFYQERFKSDYNKTSSGDKIQAHSDQSGLGLIHFKRIRLYNTPSDVIFTLLLVT